MSVMISGDINNEPWPLEGLEVVGHCPVCGGKGRELAYSGLRDRIFRCAPGQWDLYCCQGCRSAYLDPRPTRSSISLAYKSYYTHEDAHYPNQDTRSWWRRWRVAQRNRYLNEQYGYDLKPSVRMPFILSSSRRRRFDRYVGFLHFPGPGARLLDIGCGNGSFLLQMQSLGWTVCGIEPDPRSAERARATGLDVRVGDFSQMFFREGEFDAIILSHVIEHLHDPVAVLRECRRLLKPKGRIVVYTPNYDAIGRKYFGADWRGLEPPRHLVLFTEISLRQAMERCAFAVSRPSKPNLNARAMFKMSMRIRRNHYGLPGDRLPRRLKWFCEWLALKADWATRADPGVTEELILFGTAI